MSKVQTLRVFVTQRLTAAAEEIFELFERTIAEYEEQLYRSTQENERQRQLLDAVLKPEVRLHRAGDEQLLVSPEEECSPGLDQEDPEPPHIKEESEEFWTGQDQADEFTAVPVKSEEDDAPSSQLHQDEPVKARADEEDCGGPGPARTSDPDHLLLAEKPESTRGLNSVKNKSREKSFCCFECDKRFYKNSKLKIHLKTHTGEKPYSCTLCGKRFTQKASLDSHLQIHSGERPYSCSLCGKTFSLKSYLTKHMRCHSGRKPHACAFCERCFIRFEDLQGHMRIHTGEKPFGCDVCGKRFTWRGQVKNHKCVGELNS